MLASLLSMRDSHRRSGRPEEHGEVVKWHRLRNRIAHGQLPSEGINVSKIIKDFNRIEELLERQ
ncbi:MAG: hypothetical protein OXF73_02570 [Gammaproteobacteria bacterium]|nr:hypothetical protein [Gammaproteobacteria bacterium]MCY4228596.1 hypothetical protein [Gammaproteobacteria bacterium]